jgi:hypothetical protein
MSYARAEGGSRHKLYTCHAHKKLNACVMQDFWKKEEAEQKRRQEAKRLELEKIEKEQRAREEKEH